MQGILLTSDYCNCIDLEEILTIYHSKELRRPMRLAGAREASYTCIMRIVGNQGRSEFELDPVKAFRRGQTLDAMLRAATPPIVRGVTRGTHEFFNRIDAERQRHAARAVNAK